jgi:hypothetical protein
MDLLGFMRKPPTGRDHPETSFAAAEVIDAKAPAMRSQVLRFASDCGIHGFTDEELTDHFSDYQVNSIRPRRVELKADGLIVDSGKRRNNRRGNLCVVWISAATNGEAGKAKSKPKYGLLERRLKTALADIDVYKATIEGCGEWTEDHQRRYDAAQKWKN